MTAPALDERLKADIDRLIDQSVPISEFEVFGLLRRIDQLLESAHSDLLPHLFGWKAACYFRLKRYAQALECYRVALQYHPEKSPERAVTLNNYAATLIGLGRYREGANAAIEALRIEHPNVHVTLANLAEALDRVGLREDAVATLAEAVRSADLTNPSHCFVLAKQAAEVGLDDDAIELLAMYAKSRGIAGDEPTSVDAVRKLIVADGEHLQAIDVLMRSIRRSFAMAAEARRLAAQTDAESPSPTADAIDVWSATRPLRIAALGRDED